MKKIVLFGLFLLPCLFATGQSMAIAIDGSNAGTATTGINSNPFVVDYGSNPTLLFSFTITGANPVAGVSIVTIDNGTTTYDANIAVNAGTGTAQVTIYRSGSGDIEITVGSSFSILYDEDGGGFDFSEDIAIIISPVVGGALPVELTSFYSIEEQNEHTLRWSTASEINNEKFEIEESRTGREFEKIGEVQGNGTTFEEQEYSFEVDAQRPGIHSYRLKQIDFDGEFEYSKVISIDVSERENAFRIAPNPTSGSGTISLSFEDSNAKTITIYNSLSAKVYQTIAEENQSNIEITLPNLAQGIYTAELVSDRSRTTKRMFIK